MDAAKSINRLVGKKYCQLFLIIINSMKGGYVCDCIFWVFFQHNSKLQIVLWLMLIFNDVFGWKGRYGLETIVVVIFKFCFLVKWWHHIIVGQECTIVWRISTSMCWLVVKILLSDKKLPHIFSHACSDACGDFLWPLDSFPQAWLQFH